MKGVLAYLLIGSYGLLLWQWMQGDQLENVRQGPRDAQLYAGTACNSLGLRMLGNIKVLTFLRLKPIKTNCWLKKTGSHVTNKGHRIEGRDCAAKGKNPEIDEL